MTHDTFHLFMVVFDVVETSQDILVPVIMCVVTAINSHSVISLSIFFYLTLNVINTLHTHKIPVCHVTRKPKDTRSKTYLLLQSTDNRDQSEFKNLTALWYKFILWLFNVKSFTKPFYYNFDIILSYDIIF